MFCASLTFAWIAIASLTQWEGVYGQTQTNLPVNDYRGVASDASGTNLIAIVEAGPIYFSTDGGVSWDISDAPDTEEYDCVASSSSGQYVIAAAPTTTFVSSNYGRNWTQSLNVGGASNCVGVSNSGQYMVSASALEPTNACVSYSTDYGASFTTNLGPSGSNLASGCVGVGMDASGTYVVLSVSSEGLWVSSDVANAASWELTYPTTVKINAIAFGGSSFYASWGSAPYNIIQSTDYGTTWTLKTAVSTAVQTLSVDSTGTKVLVGCTDRLYFSQDSATTYTNIYYNYIVMYCAMNDNATFALWTDLFDVYTGNPTYLAENTPTPSLRPTNIYELSCGSYECPTSCPAGYIGDYWRVGAIDCNFYCEDQPTYSQCAPGGSGCTSSCSIGPAIVAGIVVGSLLCCCLGVWIFIRWYFGRFCVCCPPKEPMGMQENLHSTA